MVLRAQLPKDVSMQDVQMVMTLFPEREYVSRIRIKEKLGIYDDSTLRYKELSTKVDNYLDEMISLQMVESKMMSVSPEYSSRCYRLASL